MKFVLVAAVRVYQLLASPFFTGSCKYHPSCSQYAIDALRRYGAVRGSVLATWRLLRCNPWSHGGVDYAHDQRLFGRAVPVPAMPTLRQHHRKGH